MTQEIVFTSAPQGLAPGSNGFCTVICTDGMSDNLTERLEMLSGYRHAFTPGDRKAPVNYRHLRIKVSGRDYSVLSRICDAGHDYSQRSNKLAHHVALDASELVAAGPATVLATPSLFVPRWDGSVKAVPSGRLPDLPASRPAICQHWQNLTGDAGWAAVLAHSVSVARPKPISVIFPQGCDTLPLVVEALNLIPPAMRWNVTFSTYFTKAIAGSDILWRFVLDQTKQADALRNSPHAKVIDLAGGLGAPPDNSYSNAARTGTPAAGYSDHFAAGAGPVSAATARTPMKMRAEKPRPAPSADQSDAWYGQDDFGAAGTAMPPMPPQLPQRVPWYRKTATIVIAGILLLLVAAALLYIAYPPEPPANPVIIQPPATPESGEDGHTEDDDSSTSDQTMSGVDSDSPVSTVSETASPAPQIPPPASPSTTETPNDGPISDNPFDGLDADRLSTGTIAFFLDLDDELTSLPLRLDDPGDCTIELRSSDPALDSGLRLLESQSDQDTTSRSWTARLEPPGGGKGTTLGMLTIDETSLQFQRVIGADDDRFHRFCYSLLTLDTGSYRAVFALGAPASGKCSSVELAPKDTPVEATVVLPEFLEQSLIETLQFDVSHPLIADFHATELRSGDRFLVGFDYNGKAIVEAVPADPVPEQRAAHGILADLLISLTVVQEETDDPDAQPVSVCVLSITSSVYLNLLQKSNAVTLGEDILYGDEDLLAAVRRYDWDIDAVTRRLSSEHDLGKIRRAVRREFNRHVEDAALKVDETSAGFWDDVVERAATYYKARSASRRGNRSEFQKGLNEIVELVSEYEATLTVLRNLTEQFHEDQLHVRAYTVVDGRRIDIMHTGTNDERN